MTRYIWMIIVPIITALIILGLVLLRFFKAKHFWRRKKKDTSTKIAHTRFVRSLPEYQAAKKRYVALLTAAMVLFSISLGSLSFLISRPVNISESTEEKENRDIVFCLDISGSTQNYIPELIDYFETLLNKMDGERFGVTVFDGTYVTLSPLSDDYVVMREVLEDVRNEFRYYSMAIASTNSGSSQIGVGLAGCVDSFDRLGEAQRSRSIILATDNYSSSSPTISLLQAAQYAKDNEITVYGLNTIDTRSEEELEKEVGSKYTFDKRAVEFRDAALITNGAYYSIRTKDGSTSIIPEIIDKIMAQEAAKYDGAGQLVYTDTPENVAVISTISLLLFILIIWRLYI